METLERDEFEKLLIVNGITPKKKDDQNISVGVGGVDTGGSSGEGAGTPAV